MSAKTRFLHRCIMATIMPVLVFLLFSSCTSSKKTVSPQNDDNYGYTEKNPICVGGGLFGGPGNQRAYLNNLRDSLGNSITFKRLGSCCPFNTKNNPINGLGFIDEYKIFIANGQTLLLYLDMYTKASKKIKAPKSFRISS